MIGAVEYTTDEVGVEAAGGETLAGRVSVRAVTRPVTSARLRDREIAAGGDGSFDGAA